MLAVVALLLLVAVLSLRAMDGPDRTAPPPRKSEPLVPEPWVLTHVDGRVLRRGNDGDVSLVDDDPSLGIVRLVERSRHRMLFVFSRTGGISYLGVTLRGAARTTVEQVTQGATLVPDGLLPDAPFEDGRPVGSLEAMRLFESARANVPGAIDRIVCAAADDAALDLHGSALASRKQRIDLDAPFVWRPMAFHELAGRVGGVFQGTWIEQGPARIVFVSPIPPSAIWREPAQEDREPEPWQASDPAADARALELVGSAPADPPPVELRVPVDALLMFPLRAALARARQARRERAPWNRRPIVLAPSE